MKRRTSKVEKRVIGWREWVGLPELGVSHIKAKVDTGARTSALHAFDVLPFMRRGEPWVRFAIHPTQRDDTLIVPCESKVADRRFVTNSGGQREKRYVIETMLRVGDGEWPIELTLTNRDEMGFRMLIGRNAMHRRLIVDPSLSFQSSKRRKKRVKSSRPGFDEEE